jgi:dTDP-4-dehydrorhamnose reductase
MLKIIVVGSDEPLGERLIERLSKSNEFVIAPFTDIELNFRNEISILKAFSPIKPKLVINCLEYDFVDRAQNEPRKTFSMNRDGPSNLSDICKTFKIPLIHFSTDYIFGKNITSRKLYTEQDQPNALNVYGISKAEGEDAIRNNLREHIILRSSWVFGSTGSNFVKTIVDLAQTRNELRVVNDQYGTPTWDEDIADVVEMLCKKIENKEEMQWGTYNYCGRDYVSRYDFAAEIVLQMCKIKKMIPPTIIPITTQEYPLPAKRPYWSVLDCTKFINTFGIQTKDWRGGLHWVLEDLLLGRK